jgi:MarR family transcriptional regulator, transcriptional regulator for hemolysin
MQTQSDRSNCGQLIIRVARYWRRAIDQALIECGLSWATALPLLVLSRRGSDARQGVLAEELGLEGPSLVRIVEMLVTEGLITRREDPLDRRARLLNLTPLGQERLKEVEAVIEKTRDRFLMLEDAELAALVQGLSKLEHSLVSVLDS